MNRAMRRLSEANGRRMMLKGWGTWERLPLVSPLGTHAGAGVTEVWKNNCYIVQFIPYPDGMLRLMVTVNDGSPVRSWADLQRIKNELVGRERTAVEVFPPDSELVDEARVYHLWVLPEGQRLPFGLGRPGDPTTGGRGR